MEERKAHVCVSGRGGEGEWYKNRRERYQVRGGGGGVVQRRPSVLVCMGCILYAWRIRVESVLVSMLLPVHFLLVPVAVPVDFLTVEQVTLTKKGYLNNT